LKRLIILSLLIFLTIGVVAAEEDSEISVSEINNSTIEEIDNAYTNDFDLNDYEISYSDSISNNASHEFEITDENYETYFNKSTGNFLNDTNIQNGDIIKIGNVTNKQFNIDKVLNITSITSNDFMLNSGIKLISGSSGTNIFGLKIINNVSNSDEEIPIYLDLVNNIGIYDNDITVNNSNNSYAVGIYSMDSINLTISSNNISVYGKNNLTNGIYITRSENIFLILNKIVTIGPNLAVIYGDLSNSYTINYHSLSLYVGDSDNINILNNNIYTSHNNLSVNYGTINGVYVKGSNNILIDSNNIRSNGSEYVYSLFVSGYFDNDWNHYSSKNITITNNYVEAISKNYASSFSLGDLIGTGDISTAMASNNKFISFADKIAYAVQLNSFMANAKFDLLNNTIISNANITTGISNFASKNSIIYGNYINVSGNYSMGIGFINGAHWNVIKNNEIYTKSTGNKSDFNYGDSLYMDNTGIKLGTKSNHNIIENNKIRTSGNYSVILNKDLINNSVTYNNLLSKNLNGDASVNGNNSTNLIENNFYTIKTYLNISNLIHYYNQGGQIVAVLTDEFGNVLANKTITLLIYNGNILNATTDTNGTAYFTVYFPVGQYQAIFSFAGNVSENLNSVSTNETITILPTRTVLNGTDLNMYYKGNGNYVVVLSDFNGNPLNNQTITFNIDGKNYTATTDVNGSAFLAIDLPQGYYNITAFYNGVDGYNSSSVTNIITVNPTIVGNNIVKYYRNGTEYFAVLVDGEGNYLPNGTNVSIIINGINSTRQVGENGTLKVTINLIPGIYNITVINPVDNSTLTNNISVLSTISGNDIVKFFRNGTQYYVTVLDGQGNPIVGRNVTMNINGVFYNRTTDSNGTATLTINLNPGNYTITVTNPNDGLQMSNNILVKPTITGENIVKYYKNGTNYYVTVLDGEGKAIVGRNVTMNINGVFYNRTTDANGTARLAINLNPGNYTLTAYNPIDGLSVSNDIIVKTTMTGNDVTKTFGGNETYDVTVLDGQGKALANQEVEINIHGVFYKRTTDSDGIARLNINLNPGDYIATAYWNGYATSNKIIVNRP
jgi:hypothetical protein